MVNVIPLLDGIHLASCGIKLASMGTKYFSAGCMGLASLGALLASGPAALRPVVDKYVELELDGMPDFP